jgi:hypothetical protein
MSVMEHPISQTSSDVSPILSSVITVEVKTYNFLQFTLSAKIGVSYGGNTQRIYLSTDDFYADSSLVLGLIRVAFLMF